MAQTVHDSLRVRIAARGVRRATGETATARLATIRPAQAVLATAFAWLLAVQAPAADIAGPLEVTQSSAEAVRFTVQGLQPRWVERDVPGSAEPWYDLVVPGFPLGGGPGEFRTPRAGAWLVVPPGTRPELRIVSEAWQPASGRRLAVQPVPVMLPGDAPGEASVSEILVLPGQDLPPGALVPPGAREAFASRGAASGSAVSLGEIGWWRGRRVVSVQVSPVRHDALGAAGGVLTDGEWEVRFVPDKAAGTAAPPGEHARRLDGRNDDHFAGTFLNGELLSRLPTEAGRRGTAPAVATEGLKAMTPAATLDGTEARLAVTRTGLFRVSFARLAERGLIPPGAIAEDQLRLYQRRYLDSSGVGPYVEIEVPIHVVGEGDGFDGDDFFVFWGLRLRDDVAFQADLGAGNVTVPGAGDPYEMNNEANLYWLACAEPPAGGAWSRMATTTLPAAAGTPLASYRRLDHIEEQGAFRENNPTTTSDRMFYNWHLDTEASALINPLWAPDPAGGQVDILVGLAGYNEDDHKVRLDLVVDNDQETLLGEPIITVMVQSTQAYSVPASVLQGSTAKVRMTGFGFNGWLLGYLNWVRITYDALYRATGDRITFNCGDGLGSVPIEVTDFASADLGLIEVTDPRRPVFVQLGAQNVVAAGGGWKLSVMPEQAGGTRVFHATADFTTDGVPEFNFPRSSLAQATEDPTLVDGATPDVVVVTHADFRPALQRWIDHRVARAGGALALKVVEAQQLYDWYSGGLKDPWAIKRFCNQAVTQWGSYALVVVGDANENVLGKRVLSSATAWSRDWVPTHYHVQQALNYAPELMASDKWYACLQAGATYPVENFPQVLSAPFDLATGRLPCNSVDELNVMIDKIVLVESPQAGQDWRRRGLFIADDEWSNGYGPDAAFDLTYKSSESVFGQSEQDSLAAMWSGRTPNGLESDLVLLKPILDPLITPDPQNPNLRDMSDTRAITAAAATPVLLGALSEGGIVAHYQGHANQYVLTSEYWLEDRRFGIRKDVDSIVNTGRPWFFMGMGCHITDWAQTAVRTATVPFEPSLGEKFLSRPNAGASAVYASSGYEFISANKVFGEYIFRRWVDQPPAGLSTAPTTGDGPRSRWVVGELMWAAEADLMAVEGLSYPYDEMLAQYVLLGDPLMRLDAGEPQVDAVLAGAADGPVEGTVVVNALDATNVRTLRITAADEAGIDRLEIVDEAGADLASQLAVESRPAGARSDKVMVYDLTVPVLPYDHALTVRVYDTGAPLPADRHWELVLQMPQTAALFADGEPLPEDFVFEPGVPVPLSAEVSSAAWLTGGEEITLSSATLELSGVTVNVDKGRTMSVDFTAVLPAGVTAAEHAVALTIDGHATEYVLQSSPGEEPLAGFGRVYNFPNPMVDNTRFVFETGFSGGAGMIRVFAVSGRTVAHVRYSHGGGTDVVAWDGRDDRGDELANGTYLYRIEVEGAGGMRASPMQRLVIMR